MLTEVKSGVFVSKSLNYLIMYRVIINNYNLSYFFLYELHEYSEVTFKWFKYSTFILVAHINILVSHAKIWSYAWYEIKFNLKSFVIWEQLPFSM